MKNYNEWNEVKKDVSTKKKSLIFKTREIFWLNIGQNIGFETNGKGSDFLRPVLIFRKFSKDSFLGIPLTSQEKTDMFHFKFMLNRNTTLNYASLSQIKLFDAKRLHTKMGKISIEDFELLKTRLKELMFE